MPLRRPNGRNRSAPSSFTICAVSAGTLCRPREALQLRRRDEGRNYIASASGSKGSPDMPAYSARANE
jgi:hypothetical protein